MQCTQTPPSSFSNPLSQEREYLAYVELNSVATKEKVKAKTWLNLNLINVYGRQFDYIAYNLKHFIILSL